jgi:hypothetical protein
MAKLSIKEREWVEARQRYGLTHAQVQMGRELGLLPRSLAKIENVPGHLQDLYRQRFLREEPETVLSVEERAKEELREKALRKVNRAKAEPKAKEPPPTPQKRKKNRPHVSVPRPPKQR